MRNAFYSLSQYRDMRENLLKNAKQFSKIECDFGSGRGQFLIDNALQHSDIFFFGIETLFARVERTRKKLICYQLNNAIVFHANGPESLALIVPELFLDILYVSFPDPWPKRRHHNRRVINDYFLEVAIQRLKNHGILRILTDHTEYYLWIVDHLAKYPELEICNFHSSLPTTEFESHFLEKKTPIYRICLRKIK